MTLGPEEEGKAGLLRSVNMHVFSRGAREISRMLTMRDWLRSNEADRELYAATRRELASRSWKYVQHYADAKTTVIAEIMARAEAARVPSAPARGSIP